PTSATSNTFTTTRALSECSSTASSPRRTAKCSPTVPPPASASPSNTKTPSATSPTSYGWPHELHPHHRTRARRKAHPARTRKPPPHQYSRAHPQRLLPAQPLRNRHPHQ